MMIDMVVNVMGGDDGYDGDIVGVDCEGDGGSCLLWEHTWDRNFIYNS